MEEKFFLDVQERKICGVLHLPAQHNPPCVITCHGLFSSKDSDKFTDIAARFVAEGFAVIRFDFSGCGESSGSIADTTVSCRLQELEAVAAFALAHPKLRKTIGILGSSLGGYLSLLYAAQNPVSALCLWATPYILLEISRNIPEADLKRLKEDFFTDAKGYNLSSLLGGIKRVQIIQGEKDTIVPWQHGQEIFARVGNPKELELLPEADHSITGIDDRGKAVAMSLTWIKKYVF